jgi:hypothetical protein
MTDYVAGSRLTTNADLVDLEILTDYDIQQLTTTRMANENPPWAARHERAWTETLKRLGQRKDSIAEADLDTPTELAEIVCHYVAYLATRRGKSTRHYEDSKHYFRLWNKGVEEVQPTVDGSERPRGSYQYMRARRA